MYSLTNGYGLINDRSCFFLLPKTIFLSCLRAQRACGCLPLWQQRFDNSRNLFWWGLPRRQIWNKVDPPAKLQDIQCKCSFALHRIQQQVGALIRTRVFLKNTKIASTLKAYAHIHTHTHILALSFSTPPDGLKARATCFLPHWQMTSLRLFGLRCLAETAHTHTHTKKKTGKFFHSSGRTTSFSEVWMGPGSWESVWVLHAAAVTLPLLPSLPSPNSPSPGEAVQIDWGANKEGEGALVQRYSDHVELFVSFFLVVQSLFLLCRAQFGDVWSG